MARLLRSVDDRTQRLRRAAEQPEDERGELWLDGVKYLFVTAIEGCVDVAQQICSSERWSAPDSNAAAIRELVTHGVLRPATGTAIARATGFRNVLVHQYVAVDDAVVLDALGRLSDLDDFVREVAEWTTSAS